MYRRNPLCQENRHPKSGHSGTPAELERLNGISLDHIVKEAIGQATLIPLTRLLPAGSCRLAVSRSGAFFPKVWPPDFFARSMVDGKSKRCFCFTWSAVTWMVESF